MYVQLFRGVLIDDEVSKIDLENIIFFFREWVRCERYHSIKNFFCAIFYLDLYFCAGTGDFSSNWFHKFLNNLKPKDFFFIISLFYYGLSLSVISIYFTRRTCFISWKGSHFDFVVQKINFFITLFCSIRNFSLIGSQINRLSLDIVILIKKNC